jgi:hypothetical protein
MTRVRALLAKEFLDIARNRAALVPVAPAVVNAVCRAVGRHFNNLPVTPETIIFK